MPTPLCRCRTLYIGSAVPTVTKDGLQGIQEPLKERYPVEGNSDTRGIDSWLSVWSNGLLLEYVEGGRKREAAFFPIETLHYCAAVRYVNVAGYAVEGGGERFLPLDSPFANLPDATDPPIFAAILRRTSGIKVLECHAFICTNAKAANALVRCCFVAYADTSRQKIEENVFTDPESKTNRKAIKDKESSRSSSPSDEIQENGYSPGGEESQSDRENVPTTGKLPWQKRQQAGDYETASISSSLAGRYKKKEKPQAGNKISKSSKTQSELGGTSIKGGNMVAIRQNDWRRRRSNSEMNLLMASGATMPRGGGGYGPPSHHPGMPPPFLMEMPPHGGTMPRGPPRGPPMGPPRGTLQGMPPPHPMMGPGGPGGPPPGMMGPPFPPEMMMHPGPPPPPEMMMGPPGPHGAHPMMFRDGPGPPHMGPPHPPPPMPPSGTLGRGGPPPPMGPPFMGHPMGPMMPPPDPSMYGTIPRGGRSFEEPIYMPGGMPPPMHPYGGMMPPEASYHPAAYPPDQYEAYYDSYGTTSRQSQLGTGGRSKKGNKEQKKKKGNTSIISHEQEIENDRESVQPDYYWDSNVYESGFFRKNPYLNEKAFGTSIKGQGFRVEEEEEEEDAHERKMFGNGGIPRDANEMSREITRETRINRADRPPTPPVDYDGHPRDRMNGHHRRMEQEFNSINITDHDRSY